MTQAARAIALDDGSPGLPTPRHLSFPFGLAAATVAATFATRLPGLLHDLFDPDEAAIAAQALTLMEGGELYKDVVDRKPPLVAWIYAETFGLTGANDLRPLRVLAAIAVAGAALVLATAVRRRDGSSAGWWCAVLFVAGMVAFLPTDAQAANYAHFAVLPGAVALVAARSGTGRSALLAGVAVGVATLCRQTWLLGLVPAVVSAVRTSGRPRHALAVVAGASIPLVAVGAIVPLSAFAYWTFTGNGAFVLGDMDATQVLGRLTGGGIVFAVGHVALCALVAVAARRGPRLADLDLWLWLATGLVAAAAGLRFNGHYFIQALPAACVLAAPVAAQLRPRARRFLVAAIATPAAVAIVLAAVPTTVRKSEEREALVEYVTTHSQRDQAIMVWGNLPELYWRAERRPGGALVHSDFVTGRTGGRPQGRQTLDDATPRALDLLVAEVLQDPPQLIVDTSTAEIRGYQHYPLSLFPELAAIVDARYAPVACIDDILVWERTGHRESNRASTRRFDPSTCGHRATARSTP